MGVNKENLQRMVRYMKDVPDYLLKMEDYSDNEDRAQPSELVKPLKDCFSSGCVIGHCVHLDTLDNIKAHTTIKDGFDYLLWSQDFVFTDRFEIGSDDYKIWYFMFGAKWEDDIDEAISRMNYIIANEKVPKWFNEDSSQSYRTSIIEKYGNEFLKEKLC